MHPLKRLWQRVPRYRDRIVRGTLLAIANNVCDVGPELLIGVAIDVVVRERDSFVGQIFGLPDREQQLLVLAAITAVIWIVESLTEYLAERTWRNLAQAIQHDLRLDAYGRVQELELAWFEDRATGRIATVLNDDVNQLERFLDVGALRIIGTATTVVAVSLMFFIISPLLAVLAILPIPVIVAGSLLFQRRLQPRYVDVRDRAGELGGLIGGNLGGIATIKAFGTEETERARLDRASRAYADANAKAITLSSAFVPLIRMAILAGFIVTLVVGGHMALNGELEIGLYSVLVFMTQRLLWPLTDLGETLDLYQRGMASTARILDLVDQPVGIAGGDRGLPDVAEGTLAGAVRFEGVSFDYRDAEGDVRTPVLRGLDLDVPAGETHAIVGATGSGKSTVVKLLLRLYDADSGTISIDGVPIDALTLRALRGGIGYVSQDAFLFDGTVAENLRYGTPEAGEATLRSAAETAEAHGFLSALPQGYETQIGERGIRLSGGQRQRLTIARALVRDPAILVLDEATSAVDNETVAAIQRSLARVSHERTTIVIAHRLSTVRHADRIHVLHEGVIVESGTHDQLLAHRGRYSALWSVQTGDLAGVGSVPEQATR
ncbi:MAG TPA: ABC transporter ATP-binding protein [Solirubrobacteraceae bacterium]|nr:ABC transporter ATP-binding protein [Solirubrobacteraceae bacterium]